MIDIPDVETETLLPGKRIAPVNLSPPGNARPDVVTTSLLRRIQRQVLHQQRAGSHQAHVALEHVDQLRQFIQTGGAKPAAKRCQPPFVWQKKARSIKLFGHCAKFVKQKWYAVFSGAGLLQEHRRTK